MNIYININLITKVLNYKFSTSVYCNISVHLYIKSLMYLFHILPDHEK